MQSWVFKSNYGDQDHEFAEFPIIGWLLVTSYTIFAVVILLNLLIALMNKRFTDISGDFEVKWRCLLFGMYDNLIVGSEAPIPFNLLQWLLPLKLQQMCHTLLLRVCECCIAFGVARPNEEHLKGKKLDDEGEHKLPNSWCCSNHKCFSQLNHEIFEAKRKACRVYEKVFRQRLMEEERKNVLQVTEEDPQANEMTDAHFELRIDKLQKTINSNTNSNKIASDKLNQQIESLVAEGNKETASFAEGMNSNIDELNKKIQSLVEGIQRASPYQPLDLTPLSETVGEGGFRGAFYESHKPPQ
jgi:hypothetical protein